MAEQDAQQPPATDEQQATVIDVKLQGVLLSLVRKHTTRDKAARRVQILDARTQRFFYRGLQYLAWDEKDQALVSINGVATPNNGGEDAGSYRQTFNIYQAYAKSFMAVFSQNAPNSRAEADDPKNPLDIAAAAEANKARRIIEKQNPPKAIQIDAARLLWTDGLVVTYTRSVMGKDNKPGEKIDLFGVLETRFPMTAGCIENCGYAQINTEHDVAFLKSKFPEAAARITPSDGGDEFDRISRLAVAQGMNQQQNNSGSGSAYLATYSRTWLRSWTFEELPDGEDKDALKAAFPDGCYVGFAGETYCESRNESMDDHLALCHALPGDGMHRPSVGKSMMSAQEAFNDMMNLAQETFEYGVPSTWVDQDAIDIDAIQEQESKPKMYLPFERQENASAESHFFQEAAAEPSPAMMSFMQDVQGPLCQFLTGQQPGLFGGEMEDQKTASGYAMAKNQAMGVMGLNWMPYVQFWSTVIGQAVECAAAVRTGVISSLVPGSQKGKTETVSVDYDALREGKAKWTPETDENFPDSYSEKVNKFNTFVQQYGSSPAGQAILQEPNNQAFAKNLLGLEELVIPGADARDKQLTEISELLAATPIPDIQGFQQAMQQWQMAIQQAQAAGQQPPPQPLQQQFQTSSISVDAEFDMHAVEFAEVQTFVNSPDGQKAKAQNPMGFSNVRLHGLEHKKAMGAQQQPPQEKPSETIAFKDLPPEGQIQMAAQAGLQLVPQDIAMKAQMDAAAKAPAPKPPQIGA